MSNLDKIYESLGLDKLDEEKQKEIKDYLDETIDLKAREIADVKVGKEKENLVEQYEEKFEEYKNDITTKFSDFVDEIMEKELQIPEKIKEFARLGEKYEPVLEQLTTMIGIDKGSVDEQAQTLLRESADKIDSLKDQVNELTSELLGVKSDAKEMASHIYLRKKCDGLTEAKREKVLRILEDITEASEIDRKFEIIMEEYDGSVSEKTMYCSKCDKEFDVSEGAGETCPECEGKLGEKKKGKMEEELDDELKKSLSEKDEGIMKDWIEIIRKNKF